VWSGDAPSHQNSEKAASDLHWPWHADDVGAGGRFQKIWLCFEKLQEHGPTRGQPLKSILVAQDHNEEKDQASFKDFGLKVVTESRHLGGFIGDKAEQGKWVKEKAQAWAEGVLKISMVVGRHPQAACA
jgi:hypothetical protein